MSSLSGIFLISGAAFKPSLSLFTLLDSSEICKKWGQKHYTVSYFQNTICLNYKPCKSIISFKILTLILLPLYRKLMEFIYPFSKGDMTIMYPEKKPTHCIRKTCPCHEYPFKPHFYIVKLGYAGVYLFFLFLLQNIDCGYSLESPRRGGSNLYPQSTKIRKISKFFY